MKSVVRWQLAIVSMTIRQIIAYRVDFWSSALIYIIGNFAMSWALWAAIFAAAGKTVIAGYTLPQMIVYFLLANTILRALIGPPRFIISNEIYKGELNKYLIYPISFFNFRFVYHITHSFLFYILLLASVFLMELTPLGDKVDISLFHLLSSAVFIFLAVMTYFFVAACLELVAFWADNVWSLLILLRFFIFLFGGVFLPVTTFPEWAQPIIKSLPFYLMVNVPVNYILGKIDYNSMPEIFGLYAFWIIAFALLAKFTWKRGTLQYTGVGI